MDFRLKRDKHVNYTNNILRPFVYTFNEARI